MGKYTNRGRTKGLALVDPEAAARRVVEAWEEVVTRYGDQLRTEYYGGITAFTGEREKQEKIVRKLADWYARIVPQMAEKFKQIMAPIRQTYRTEKAAIIAGYYGLRR